MNALDLRGGLPLLLLAGTPVLVMLGIAVRRNHALAAGLSIVGLIASFGALASVGVNATRGKLTDLLTMDGFAVFGMGLLILATLAVVVLSYVYLAGYAGWREEYYVLVLVATLGAAVLVASTHFASLFLGLETLSVSLYAVIAFFPGKPASLEAGLKYLVLAAGTSAFLLFGAALIYAEGGHLGFDHLGDAAGLRPSLALAGMAFVLVGIAFKLALVPFHMWTPDIYQGAPVPVAAFVATVSKGALLLLLLRFFHSSERATGPVMQALLAGMAVASMLVGNLLALLQQNLKRILAYSSIGHLGYMLVAFQARGPRAANAAGFYLVAYLVTMLGAFAVLTILSTPEHEAEMLDDYRGLFRHHPVLAGTLTLMLLSLAGIPLTAGFMAKVWILAAGTSAAAWISVLVLVAGSTIGLYYYLRIVVVMLQPRDEGVQPVRAGPALGSRIALGCLAVLLVWFGVYPDRVLNLVGDAMATLGW